MHFIATSYLILTGI